MPFNSCHHTQTNGEMCARYTENDVEFPIMFLFY